MKKCPNCGSEEFFVTAHVTQDWLVDSEGNFIQAENQCVEVTHQPNNDDLWICADCGYDAEGEKFEIADEEETKVKKYTLENYKEFSDKALDMPPMDEFDEGIIDEDKWYEENKVHIIKGEHEIVLDYTAEVANELTWALIELYNEEFGDGTTPTDNRVVESMMQNDFKVKLKEAFGVHMFMKKRDKHTINELLYILEHDSAFKDMNFNIAIIKLDGGCYCIPCLDAFVPTEARAMWFEDAKVEFEVEEVGTEQYNCITIYESEGI